MMKFFKRILGICETPAADEQSWRVSDNQIILDLNKIPAFSKPGSAVRLEGRGLADKILLVHGTDGNYYAFVNKCSHMGRRIDPMAGESALCCCSVSKSAYTYDGKVISGPAKSPLRTLPVQVNPETGILIAGMG
ncbi:MAG: ubiquinol-cytochrome c reductase iron-sulfur subunit [Desulfococcaceae bacterium]